MKKRGQTQLSFGTIFSIILIIVFIGFAIFAVRKFLGVQEFAQVEKFKDDLQTDIDKMWRSTQGSQKLDYSLPRKISEVCLINDEFENIYFVPNDFQGGLLNNIDFSKTIPANSPRLCMQNTKGKVTMTIKKNYGENLVIISR